MENFSKITTLFTELLEELSTLKRELENDTNYSVSHAEIVTSIEEMEEGFGEFVVQMRDIEKDVVTLNEKIENRSFRDFDDDDDDEKEAQMYSPDEDDDY